MTAASVGLPPRRLGGGRSGAISENSASDISLEYRARITSYFARSASFHGIANLPKLLQTTGINSREADELILGQALSHSQKIPFR